MEWTLWTCNNRHVTYFKGLSFLPTRLQSFLFLPSLGASGGIVTAWDSSDFSLSSSVQGAFSLTTVFSTTSDLSFTVTNVYSPCDGHRNVEFLSELSYVAASISGPWATVGDFNFLREPGDNSNASFDQHNACLFNSWIDDAGLIEIPLLDRLYTWTNNQSPQPLLASIGP